MAGYFIEDLRDHIRVSDFVKVFGWHPQLLLQTKLGVAWISAGEGKCEVLQA